MPRSMTAFAREECREAFGQLVCDLRSVNHRYLEVSVRLPEEMRAMESVARERVNKALGRGKVDLTVRFRPAEGGAEELKVDGRLAGQVLAAANELGSQMPDAPGPAIMDVLRWPGVIEASERDLSPVQQALIRLLETALQNLIESREREGAKLVEIIGQRCTGLGDQVARVRSRMPDVIAAARERLRARVNEVAEGLDENRLEQEIALLVQKMDVDEEMDRLTTHIAEVERVLKQAEPIGRRLDFLMQELNREANTLGSKSADSETTAASVEMKVLIEQMREQVQNLE